MEPLVQAGGVSRRASLLAAFGAATVLTGAAAEHHATSTRYAHGSMFLIGDSWAAGLHADPARALGQVAAEALEMELSIDAVSGTGYVNTAGHENYLQRARKASGSPRLVVVQGGSNDDRHGLGEIHTAAVETFHTLRERFPSARMLALGPGPDPEPVDEQQLAVDHTLRSAAESLGVTYISMFDFNWVPNSRSELIIDPSTHHPTISGQEYLGFRLAAATRILHPTLFTRPLAPTAS